ncbi:MAG: DUF4870 domain-containing protein [Sedimentisphaerales bacterium]|nr:DUF4870 domain-containing protein [Sedimentisphaerales bacterium]
MDETTEQNSGAEQNVRSGEISKDARMWGMFCHLAALAGYVVPAFGWVIGPLVVWLIKKEEFPFVNEQGKESINFQISMFIYAAISGLLCFLCIGFFLLAAVAIVDIVFIIMAAIKANNGEHYRYPLTIRFIK